MWIAVREVIPNVCAHIKDSKYAYLDLDTKKKCTAHQIEKQLKIYLCFFKLSKSSVPY